MGTLAFIILLASFALCMAWYLRNYDHRRDGDTGFLLMLNPDMEDEKPVLNEDERLFRGADAVKYRVKELGISAKAFKTRPAQERKDRLREKKTSQKNEDERL